jgi:prophage antirepressor-like protein
MENQNSIIPFEGQEIRKIWHGEQWYFSVIDIIYALTDSPQPSSYWNKVKKTILKENQSLPFWQRLNLPRLHGRNYPTDCANTEGVFRILMSVPSPKAEPLKLWLASLGKQAIDEAENPELLTERQAEIYRAKGYTEEWIKERLQSINTRKLLTDEWKQRGVKEGQEYALLTAIISKGTFGITPTEHKDLKGLERQNLRDNMTDLELIFTALGEATTRRLAIKEDAQGFNENKDKAVKGGKAAGIALDAYEAQTGLTVVSTENFLNQPKPTGELPPNEKAD